MSERIRHLSLEARKLTPAGRAELIDNLLASLLLASKTATEPRWF